MSISLWRRQKAEKPRFIRTESWRLARLSDSWRAPKGLDNKIRREIKGWPPRVKIGYRKVRRFRGRHPSGMEEVLVHRVEDLAGLRPSRHVVRIASGVGRRKRMTIVSEALKRGLKVVNPGGGER